MKPSTVDNGGDPTGVVTNIKWRSWGSRRAVGAGTGLYVASDKSVAEGSYESTTIVAFNLGTCKGKYMYQSVEWYFPRHGQHFDPSHYINICTGQYAGGG